MIKFSGLKRVIGISCFIILFLFFEVTSVPASEDFFKTLDSYIEKVRKEWEVPGLAVALVKDRKMIFAKGYGVRKLGEYTPVTPETLFGIASNTKAFTAAALAILVDEGKIKWDDPVIKYLPDFCMYDPYVTREITVRDLLTHRSGLGLGAGDLLYWPQSTYSRKEIIYRVRFIKPAFSFRSRFAYCNILYIVAGEIIPAVTGKTWSEFIKERIFKPLGMTFSNTSIKEFCTGGNIASPHTRFNGQIKPIAYENLDSIGPAGAINSNVIDMSKWIIVQLNSGLIRNTKRGQVRLFSADASKEMWFPQTIIPIREYPPELSKIKPNFFAYGLGWMLRDYYGHKIVYHTGSIRGMVSKVTLVPDLKLGIVVLTNQEARQAYEAITYYILDYYLGVSPIDWITAFKQAEQRTKKRIAEIEKNLRLKRVKNTKPSLDISKYTGRYIDQWYGEMVIEEINNKLVMRFLHTPALVGDLEHWHYDTFIVRWRDRSLNADAFVTFILNYKGEVEEVKMLPVSPLTDFSFDFQDLLFKPVGKKR
jgi:CubicO group peptidase (beta-lactamase class C family)